MGGVTTAYVGNYFEWTNAGSTAYYYAGGQRIAMRNGNTTGTSGLYWLLADHLGSTNKVVNANGTLHSWQLYKAWGEWRAGSTPGLLTDYNFTGQKVVSGVGLYFYGARWYDTLTHFVQPDSIIPDLYNPQNWNRYAYARYNPLRYIDPSGHKECEYQGDSGECDWKTPYVWNQAEKLLELYGGKDDLKALTGIIRTGASVYQSYEELMPVLSNILIGTPSGAPLALTEAAGKCGGIGRDLECAGNTKSFQDKGFHEDFQDGHNQIFHYWAYVANTYSASFPMALLGASAAGFGNVVHEIVQGILGDDGTSWQDYVLAGAGINTGISISMGIVPTSDLADFVYNLLGPSGPGALGSPGFITPLIPLPGSPPQ